jgi:Flp pilus assembly protein TadG
MKIVARHKRRCGQSQMLEAAVVMLPLLLLTMGLIQYGFIMNARTTVTYLARQGARNAAIRINDENKVVNGVTLTPEMQIKRFIQDKARMSSLRAADIPDSAITITPTGATNLVSGKPITVTVTYDMRRKIFLPVNFPGLNLLARPYTVSMTHVIE